MKQNQKEILLSSFIISHFSYCPLIWMFCSKKSTKKINAVHERSLRIIRNDYESLYPLLLEETHQTTFHQRCTNSLTIEVYDIEYFQVKRKYVQSPKLRHLPDRKYLFIEIRTWCYSTSR